MEIEQNNNNIANDNYMSEDEIQLYQYEYLDNKLQAMLINLQNKYTTKQTPGWIYFTNIRIILVQEVDNKKFKKDILLNSQLENFDPQKNPLFQNNQEDEEQQQEGEFNFQPLTNGRFEVTASEQLGFQKIVEGKKSKYFGKYIDSSHIFRVDKTTIIILDQDGSEKFEGFLNKAWKTFLEKNQEENYVKAIILACNENLNTMYQQMVLNKKVLSDKEFWQQNKQFKHKYCNPVSSYKQQKVYNESIQEQKQKQTQNITNDQKEVNLNYNFEKGFDLESFQNLEKNSIIDQINQNSFKQYKKEVVTTTQDRKEIYDFQSLNEDSFLVKNFEDQLILSKKNRLNFQNGENYINQSGIEIEEQQTLQRQKNIQEEQIAGFNKIPEHVQKYQWFRNQFQTNLIENKENQNEVIFKIQNQAKEEIRDTVITIATNARFSNQNKEMVEKNNAKDKFVQRYKLLSFQTTELLQWFYKELKLKEENKSIFIKILNQNNMQVTKTSPDIIDKIERLVKNLKDETKIIFLKQKLEQVYKLKNIYTELLNLKEAIQKDKDEITRDIQRKQYDDKPGEQKNLIWKNSLLFELNLQIETATLQSQKQ